MEHESTSGIPTALVPHLGRGLRFRGCHPHAAPTTLAASVAADDETSTLLSRDETTREIHHRVKNNLQTIASLLRLQGRRLASPEAKEALAQSVRRIRAMALVHETLAGGKGNTVPFAEVLRGLVRLVEDGRARGQRPIHFELAGDLGNLAPEVATPLVSALGELLDNAARHAFPTDVPGDAEGSVIVHLTRKGTEAVIDVWDNGVGLPVDFCPEASAGLGLSIVHSLITGEFGGTLSMRSDGGTWIHLHVPLGPASGGGRASQSSSLL